MKIPTNSDFHSWARDLLNKVGMRKSVRHVRMAKARQSSTSSALLSSSTSLSSSVLSSSSLSRARRLASRPEAVTTRKSVWLISLLAAARANVTELNGASAF